MIKKHTDTYRVRAYELGPDAKVRTSSLCNYLQETAGVHADALNIGVGKLLETGLTWVLARFQVRFHAFPALGEELTVVTWPSAVERLQCRRDFQMRDAAGQAVCEAVSWWVVVDVAARRVVRIPEVIAELHPIEKDFALDVPPSRLPAPEAWTNEHHFPVRLSDIDVNQHVNNVHYIQWAIESAQPTLDTTDFARPSYLEIVYKSECVYGDTVFTRTSAQEDAPDSRLHLLIRRAPNGEEREAARVLTVWK